MDETHPPIATRVAAIDFDGTIMPWQEPMFSARDPLPGAVDAIKALKDAGYRVVIFTSRLSRTWAVSEIGSENKYEIGRFLEKNRSFIEETLAAAGIPWDDITAEKVPAEFYIDDKAFRFEGDWGTIQRMAVAAGKGPYFWEYHSNRGQRVHRIADVFVEQSYRNPDDTWSRAIWRVDDRPVPDRWDKGVNRRAVVKFMCGYDEIVYGWNGEDHDALIAKVMDHPRLLTQAKQPMCRHCVKSPQQPWRPE